MPQRPPFVIARLCDRPGLIPDLVVLYQAVWPAWYGPDGPGDALSDLTERNRDAGFPMGLVALLGDQPVGVAGLAAQSFGSMAGEGPWLIGLAVDPAFRRRGCGAALVARAEAEMRGQASWLYGTTDAAAGLLTRRGWVDLRRAGEGPDRVYRLTL